MSEDAPEEAIAPEQGIRTFRCGHPRTPENTTLTSMGPRCRDCNLRRSREHYAKRRASGLCKRCGIPSAASRCPKCLASEPVTEGARIKRAAQDLLAACEAAGAFTSHVFSCPACLAEWSNGNYFCKEGNILYETYLRLRDAAIAKARGQTP